MLDTHAIEPPRSRPPSAADEELYRRHFLRPDARRAVIVVAVVTVIWALGTLNDRQLFGFGRPFFVLLGVHAACALINAAIAAVLLRSREPRAHDRAIALFLATTVLAVAYVISTRPPEYLGHAVLTTFALSMFYLVMPGPLAVRTVAAFGLSVASLWVSVRSATSRVGLNAVIATHVLSHALELPVARWLEGLRREGFFAQAREHRAREELAQKAADLEIAKERAETMARAKSEFLATMSHEFRTPMNAVLGLSDVLSGAPLPEEHQRMAQTIHQSARALLALLNDILDLSKIEAGKMTVEQAPFDVRQTVRSAVDLVRYQATEKRLELGLAVAADVPEWLLGDAVRLRQVLLNLLSNAVKFTERGSVRVDVRLQGTEGALHQVVLSVRDTGLGIPPEALGRLFAPFEQGSTEIQKQRAGTGLGLSICKHLVGLMGGEIQVESEVGRGSLFEFSIRAAAAEAPVPVSAQAPAVAAAERQLEILVVDDDALNRQVAKAMLGRLGHRPDVAASGEEALSALEQKGYDLVFMDLRMPGMSGIEATARIRATPSARRRPRIVALTASAFEEDRTACLGAGMDDFLSKPLLLSELRAAMARAAEAAAKSAAAAPPAPAPAASRAMSASRATGEEQRVTLSADALDRLRELEGPDNPGVFQDICRRFAEDAQKKLTELSEAVAAGDAETARRAAHTLKSTSGFLGAVHMVEDSLAAEAAARRGDLPGCAAAAERLREELVRVKAALASVLAATQTHPAAPTPQ
jgi:signal transduction histidine kinase/CheY-like chemotaxis protein/HPt (histidine-containing phosphotransfer) domain-containing protein